MKSLRGRPSALAALLLLAATAAAPAADLQADGPTAPSTVPGQTATLHLFRPKLFVNGAIKPGIVVDDVEYAALPADACMRIPVAAGAHTLRLKLSDRYEGDSGRSFDIESGQTVYAVLRTNIEAANAYTSRRVFGLEFIAEHDARREIDCTRQIDPVSGKKHRKSWFWQDN